jgi:hypothetical protein
MGTIEQIDYHKFLREHGYEHRGDLIDDSKENSLNSRRLTKSKLESEIQQLSKRYPKIEIPKNPHFVYLFTVGEEEFNNAQIITPRYDELYVKNNLTDDFTQMCDLCEHLTKITKLDTLMINVEEKYQLPNLLKIHLNDKSDIVIKY